MGDSVRFSLLIIDFEIFTFLPKQVYDFYRSHLSTLTL